MAVAGKLSSRTWHPSIVRSTPGNEDDAAVRGVGGKRSVIELVIVQRDGERVVSERRRAVDQGVGRVRNPVGGVVRGVGVELDLEHTRTLFTSRAARQGAQWRADAQQLRLDVFVAPQSGRIGGVHHLPLAHHVGVVGHLHRKRGVLLGQQDRTSLVLRAGG